VLFTRQEAMRTAKTEGLFPVPCVHRNLMRGSATGRMRMSTAHPDPDRVDVPIDCGADIFGTIAARDAGRLATKIIRVVNSLAQTSLLSVRHGALTPSDSAHILADIMALPSRVAEVIGTHSGAKQELAKRDGQTGQRIGVILCRGNIDRDWIQINLANFIPAPGRAP